MKKIINFFKEVKAEIAKVEWPSKQEMIYSFMLVVIASLVASFFFFAVDWVFFTAVDKTLTFAGSI